MVGKFLKNPISHIVLGIFCVFTYTACIIVPIDLPGFLEDEKIEDIYADIITLDDRTGDELTARNRRIEGINPNSYYLVEEIKIEKVETDEDDEEEEDEVEIEEISNGIKFVTAEGALSSDFDQLDRVTGTRIPNLENENTYYIVWKAQPLLGMSFSYIDTDSLPAADLPADSGKETAGANGIHLPPPEETYYLEFPASIINADTRVRVFPVSPPGSSQEIDFSDGNYIIELKGNNTITDYVIADLNDDGEILLDSDEEHPKSFYVLRVTIDDNPPNDDPPEGGRFSISVTFDIFDGSPVVNGGLPLTLLQSELETEPALPINVNNAADFDTGSFKWYFNDTEIGTAPSVNIDLEDNLELLLIGTHLLTVIASIEGIQYSAIMEVVVTL